MSRRGGDEAGYKHADDAKEVQYDLDFMKVAFPSTVYERARTFVAQLEANVQALEAKRIAWEEFNRLQREVWTAIRADKRVHAVVRRDLLARWG